MVVSISVNRFLSMEGFNQGFHIESVNMDIDSQNANLLQITTAVENRRVQAVARRIAQSMQPTTLWMST
jgi:hypothetical protein